MRAKPVFCAVQAPQKFDFFAKKSNFLFSGLLSVAQRIQASD